MAKGLVNIYAGDGKGKSPAALGRALQDAMEGKSVVVLQFLKGNGMKSQDFLRRMEPEIKLFCFEKSDESYENLSEVLLTASALFLLARLPLLQSIRLSAPPLFSAEPGGETEDALPAAMFSSVNLMTTGDSAPLVLYEGGPPGYQPTQLFLDL